MTRLPIQTVLIIYFILSHDVASGSEITPCTEINSPPVALVEEPGFKNVKNKHLGMSPF